MCLEKRHLPTLASRGHTIVTKTGFIFIYLHFLFGHKKVLLLPCTSRQRISWIFFPFSFYHVIIRESQGESPFNLTKIYQQNLLQNTFKKECSKLISLSLVLPNCDCNIFKVLFIWLSFTNIRNLHILFIFALFILGKN